MPITVNQIAEQCGVSRTTVLRALNNQGSVRRETKEKILRVAGENNYRPNLIARSLHHGRTMSLGVVTINVENFYFVQSLNVIKKEADRRGYFTNIVICDEDAQMERKLIQGLAERQMEGILISPINKGAEFEEFLQSLHIPVVCIGNRVADSITTVQADERSAAENAVRFIRGKGYRRIIFVCPPLEQRERLNIDTHEQRLQGFLSACGEGEDITCEVIGDLDYVKKTEKALSDRRDLKTAVLCSGDLYALSIMRWAQDSGVSIPGEFGVMGFDNISILDYITPKLTTVSTNLESVAITAVNELLQQIESEYYAPKTIYLNHQILDRETI